MFLFLLVKSSNAFDSHVVRLRCSRGEYDVFRISTNQIRHMLDEEAVERHGL